ncbi:hypothetical protein [Parasutterella excrementihominis]|uniref:hypothetical protein n=1 Tax=Parasutterella excrementihominis TaxID=487175 RepID=UPI0027B97BBD|nr:hypothetical protein [Parasutterella excrementihominis]
MSFPFAYPDINPDDFIIKIKPEDSEPTNRNPLSDALICSFMVEYPEGYLDKLFAPLRFTLTPEERRIAILKAWGLLKLNDHLIYEERAKRWI